jgi:AraC-like DNA-binding protein
LITLSDPLAVPQTFNELRIVKGDRSGFRISFPTEWLFEKFEKTAFRQRIQQSGNSLPPQSLIESVHRAIAPHIHDEDLTVERAAELCGIDKRRLSRKLQSKGTTINKEIAYMRQERATNALANSNQRISEIAAKVGFHDPTAFSRAFKNWTGQSPHQYRKSHRD